jgi:hypothetical protein
MDAKIAHASAARIYEELEIGGKFLDCADDAAHHSDVDGDFYFGIGIFFESYDCASASRVRSFVLLFVPK